MLEFNFSPFPIIETERLRLRQMNAAGDIDFLFSLRSDKEVMKYVDRPLATERKDIEEMYEKVGKGIAENRMITWQIEMKNDHSPCGQIGYYRNDKENHRGEVGYMIAPVWAGKGICSEALTAVLDYGFNKIKFHSIEGNVNPGNSTSIHILEKHGFIKEAYFRENYYFNNKFLDSAIYSLLASDWQKIQKKST